MTNFEKNKKLLNELVINFPTFKFEYDKNAYYQNMSISATANLDYHFSISYDMLNNWFVITTHKQTARQQHERGDFDMVLNTIKNLMYLGF